MRCTASCCPATPEALIRHTALEHGGGPCRLRVLLDLDGQVGLQVAPLPAAGARAPARDAVPGGLGDRKWRDRRLIDALEDGAEPEAPLARRPRRRRCWRRRGPTSSRGSATRLVTPTLDGRLLPGVTRRRLVARAAVPPPAAAGSRRAARPPAASWSLARCAACSSPSGLMARRCAAPDDRLRTLVERYPRL